MGGGTKRFIFGDVGTSFSTHGEGRDEIIRWGFGVTSEQEPTDTSKQPIITRYLGHVTGYQPIRDQYFLIWSVRADFLTEEWKVSILTVKLTVPTESI
eukprot:sb/3478914/